MKIDKKKIKSLTKEEQELLSMVATMASGGSSVVEPQNLHNMSSNNMKKTIEMMKRESKTMSAKGKKIVQSIIKKTSPLKEQYGYMDDEEEKIKKTAMAALKNAQGGMEKMSPEMKGMLKPGSVRPLETGQPGAVSADLGFEDLAGMVRKQPLPPPPSAGGPPIPQMPGMGQKPPMMPGMGQKRIKPMSPAMTPGMKPPMPPVTPAPTVDDQPALPPKPRQAPPAPGGMPGMPGMPGMGGPQPSETEGPRAMEPAKNFAQRMGIKDIERHHLRPEEDDAPTDMAPETADAPKPGMPAAGMMPPQEGPKQGQPVPPQLAQDPAAPKEMPRQLPPGTTEASQEFIDKYAQQIKSFLKIIAREEEEKFARGRDLTAMPKSPMKEQAANAVGSGMSPVVGGEGEIKGRDKMLGGKTAGMRRRKMMENYTKYYDFS